MFGSQLIPYRVIQEYRPPKSLVKKHHHPFYHLICATTGKALLNCDEAWYPVKPDEFFLVPPGSDHMIYTAKGMYSSDLKFTCDITPLSETLTSRSFWTGTLSIRQKNILQSIIEEATLKQDLYIESISSQIFIFLLDIIRDTDSSILHKEPVLHNSADDTPQSIYQAVCFIDEHLTDNLSVSELARMLGYSSAHFSTIFKKAIGVSPQQYFTLKRIDLAKKMLLENRLSISAISDSLHFCNTQAFSNTFKRCCGLSPKKYLAESRGCSYINLVDSPLLPPDNTRDVELVISNNPFG